MPTHSRGMIRALAAGESSTRADSCGSAALKAWSAPELSGEGQLAVLRSTAMMTPHPRQPERLDNEESDHARTEDDRGVIQRDGGAVNGVEGDGHRLDQGGLIEGEVAGEPVENVLGDRNVFGEGAVLPVVFTGDPQHAAVVAEVDLAAAAKGASPAVDRGVEGDAVAGFPGGDARPNGGDFARGFVAHDDGRAAASGAAIHAVDVAAADATGLHGDEDFARTGRGIGRVA